MYILKYNNMLETTILLFGCLTCFFQVAACADYCIYDGVIEYCDYDCCAYECCGSLIPIIVGAVIGGIVVISIIVIIVCLLIKSKGHKGRVVHPQTGTNMATVHTTGMQQSSWNQPPAYSQQMAHGYSQPGTQLPAYTQQGQPAQYPPQYPPPPPVYSDPAYPPQQGPPPT